ncbi:MAG: 3-deoxy-D-manno-octulosonic acid transferase [Candidatus Omnitrophica bacterium]|nr:3-deoxy-D-manno-octulosonic acid transferase [Candidatus Omnitrophota bacterium]
MVFLIDIVYLVLAIFYLPYLMVKGKWHNVYCVRFGFLDKDQVRRIQQRRNIWIHAVSVGEVLAVIGLIERIRKVYPNYSIVCSTVTKTGQALAKERLQQTAEVIYAPLDFSLVVRKFIHMIRPELFIAAETEFWPNLYTLLHRNNVPVMIINGRISDSSFQGYQRFGFLTRPVLSKVRKFCMQSSLDAERVITLGARPENVQVTGNIKFDAPVVLEDSNGQKLNPDYTWLLAGSTHPGEEEVLIEVYQKLAQKHSNLRLVLVPRHIERSNDVCEILDSRQLKAVLFSQLLPDEIRPEDVIVVDEIGRLRALYQQADLVFVGKTLKVGGGQNMIEPAQYGKPVFVGPLTDNFKDAMRLFLEKDAIVQVQDEKQLYQRMAECLDHPDSVKRLAEAARQVTQENRGVEEKTFQAVAMCLKS